MKLIRYLLLVLTLTISVNMSGQYNPTNPSEPGVPSCALTLKSIPEGAGYFNINAVTQQTPGASIRVRAYNYSNFQFAAWEVDGKVVSTDAQFDYTMPQSNATLTARYNYNPSNPSEPEAPVVTHYSKLYMNAKPSNGGTFNIDSGNSYEVGTSVNLRAYNNSNFRFLNWTENDEVISTNSQFYYTVKETDSYLVANYVYAPSNPTEPTETKPKYKLFLESNPVGGGYFNVESGNKYEEGQVISLRAYNNQYYTFTNWTLDGEEFSTNYYISYTMPAHDVKLCANYTYNYTPSNPSEPGQAGAHVALYGMTENAIRNQSIMYPIHLENSQKQVKGVVVDVKFPGGFIANTDEIVLSGRALAHTVNAQDRGENTYRLFVQGEDAISDENGKLLDIPVTVPDTATMGQTYRVELANGYVIGMDNSQTSVSTRSGGILIETVAEDGLYARFTFDRYQDRVKFENISSENARRYEWNFGDGETSTEAAPFHVYAEPGIYTVTLSAYGEYGIDVAETDVLINNPATWTAQGPYYLTTGSEGVRSFNSVGDIINVFNRSTLSGNLRILVESGQQFSYALDDNNVETLCALNAELENSGYTLSFEKDGGEDDAVILLGNTIDGFDADILALLINLSKCMTYSGVKLKIWGIEFDMNQLKNDFSQTVCSGETTALADFTLISPDLNFVWTLQNSTTEISGFAESGTQKLSEMTIINETEAKYDLTYHVAGSKGGLEFYSFDYHIQVNPAMIGAFDEMLPDDASMIDGTEVTLSWTSIKNAKYDVYLWNIKNPNPTTPIAANLTTPSYSTSRFCTYGNTYHWYVIAHNDCQELFSDTLSFTIRTLQGMLQPLAGEIVFTSNEEYVYDGTAKRPKWEFTETISKKLVEGVDYTVSYKDNIYPGTGFVLVNGIGNYTGTLTALFSISKAELPEGKYTIQLPDDDICYDGKSHAASYTAEKGVGAITFEYYNSVDGTVVEGDPIDAGSYIVYAQVAEGDYYLGGETTMVGEFTIYSFDESEWEVLQQVKAEVESFGWKDAWNMDQGIVAVSSFKELTIKKGHVSSVDFSGLTLTGSFPMSVFGLSRLEGINVSANNLSGDISALFVAMAKTQPDFSAGITSLDISGNSYTGNVGILAKCFPSLTMLNVSANCFADLYPAVSANVTDLNISRQRIDKIVSINLSELSADDFAAAIPTIILYDHANQTYSTDFNMMCTKAASLPVSGNEWAMQISVKNGRISLPYVSQNNAYHGVSGDLVNVFAMNSDGTIEGSTFKVQLNFDQGDANFINGIDATDLQATILYAFGEYRNYPFNFTAADTYKDGSINVQDVICTVNILIAQDVVQHAPMKKCYARTAENAEAYIYLRDGNVILNSDVPIAALSMKATGDIEWCIGQYGMPQTDTVGSVVGYSLSGMTLPIGETVIGHYSGEANIYYASLSDVDAQPVFVIMGEREATDIETIKNVMDNANQYYDLMGRRSSGLNNGINIIRKGNRAIKVIMKHGK